MKRLFTTLFLLTLIFVSVFAQAPQKMNYQAVVRNANNSLVTNQNVAARISILQGSATGSAVYIETQTVATNTNGLMTLSIGEGTAVSGTFSSIDWANGPYFLKSEIDPNGGVSYSIESVQQLLSVPYALYANEAGNSFSGDYNDLTNTPTIPTVPANVSALNMQPAGFYNSATQRCEELHGKAYFYTSDYYGGSQDVVHMRAECGCWELIFIRDRNLNDAYSVRCVKDIE